MFENIIVSFPTRITQMLGRLSPACIQCSERWRGCRQGREEVAAAAPRPPPPLRPVVVVGQ